MKTFNSITTFSAHTERMQQWFDTCLGQYLLAQEQQYFDSTVANILAITHYKLGVLSLIFFVQIEFLSNLTWE